MAKLKIVAFGESLKAAILPLLGISIAFKGFTTIIDLVGQASEKFENLQTQLAQFKATIASTDLGQQLVIEQEEKYCETQKSDISKS